MRRKHVCWLSRVSVRVRPIHRLIASQSFRPCNCNARGQLISPRFRNNTCQTSFICTMYESLAVWFALSRGCDSKHGQNTEQALIGQEAFLLLTIANIHTRPQNTIFSVLDPLISLIDSILATNSQRHLRLTHLKHRTHWMCLSTIFFLWFLH